MLKFFISLFIVLFTVNGFTQNQEDEIIEEEIIKKDSISYKTAYGFRVGFDISKPILSLVEKEYKGLELVGDYRISKRWYVATELGYENKTINEEFLNVDSKGEYIRLGANYNTYNNWLNMSNEIYVGGRYGFAMFNQKLNSYTPNVNTEYFPSKPGTLNLKTADLNAHWLEFHLGLKVETIKNLFLGFHGSYKIGLKIDNPEDFKTLYSPGFNRVLLTNTGFGFNYTVSYLIPFSKK